MSILSDRGIMAAYGHELMIEPFSYSRLQPASVDLRLGTVLLDPVDGTQYFGPRDLEPGGFVLGSTVETITLRGVAARFEGKSSLGRIGLLAHVSAGFIDPGFSGQLTVEIVNLSRAPITLRSGMPIGQVCFYRLDQPPGRMYGDDGLGSHYQDQTGPTASVPNPITKIND